jgi:hypothetical protein
LALAYAAAPDAIAIRAEIARTLIDLLGRGRAARLGSIRELITRAGDLATALARRPDQASGGRAAQAHPSPTDEAGDAEAGPTAAGGPARAPAAERRRAALALLEIWRDLAHDLALARSGDLRGLRDPGLIDELLAVARRLAPDAAGEALARIARAGELLDSNVAPELALDVLVLAWPRVAGADAA